MCPPATTPPLLHLKRTLRKSMRSNRNYTASYYGGAVALLEGIKAAGTTDRKAVMEAVKGLKDLKVPVGVITCDENNDLVHNINVARIENKIPKFIKAVSVE